ncbi:ComEA family DNA-binding protein [Tepidicella baoligensis]|uniref:ComEA family DNA-binding protein n=1 Tax=Tepidicella baoligensis TaxID=2707016 RepID=UPI0015DA1186|nr:helix-hairpin-helix domain-containing protein [Tepidicella baoligensis]
MNTFKCRLGFRLLVLALLTQIGLAWSAVEANQAPPQDLVAIKGIGPATSQRIVEARREQPFRDWDDFIRRVRGIGPTTAGKLSANGLTVNGTRYPAAAEGSPEVLWQPMVPRPLESPR